MHKHAHQTHDLFRQDVSGKVEGTVFTTTALPTCWYECLAKAMR